MYTMSWLCQALAGFKLTAPAGQTWMWRVRDAPSAVHGRAEIATHCYMKSDANKFPCDFISETFLQNHVLFPLSVELVTS